MTRRNVVWAILALLASILLWFVITAQQNPYREETIQSISVALDGLPSGLVATGVKPQVSVRVSAPNSAWGEVGSSDIVAYVDASKVTAGHQELPVSVRSEDWRVRIVSWMPSIVGVDIEKAVKREIEVSVMTVGEVPFGYVAKPATVSPQRITISGPERLVNSVAGAFVELKLTDVRESVSRQVAPTLVGTDGSVVRDLVMSPEYVLLEAAVQQQLAYKTVPVQAALSGSVALGYRISGLVVDPPTVSVVGDAVTLDSLTALTTLPVNVSGASADVTVNTDLDLPQLISMARRQSIVVRVYVEAIDSSQAVQLAPVVAGLDTRYTAVFTPSAVLVTVAGKMSMLNSLRAQDLRAELDCSGLGQGVYELAPKVLVPSTVRVLSVIPSTVSVSIK